MLSEMAVTTVLETGCQFSAFVFFELSVFLLACAPKLIKLKPSVTENWHFDDFLACGSGHLGKWWHTSGLCLSVTA
jgi:hypothetical protein